MIELKYPDSIYLEEYDVNVRPYLTVDEIKLIATKMLEQNDPILRTMIKNCYILALCAGIDKTENMDYNLLVASGIIGKVLGIVKNWYDIDDYILEVESINTQVKTVVIAITEFLNKLDKKIPKGKKLEEFLSKLAVMNNADSSKRTTVNSTNSTRDN